MDVPLHSENFEHQARCRLGILYYQLSEDLSVAVRKRRLDLANQNKLILDALTGIAYLDDSQINELHLFRAYDPANPRIEVEIATL